MDIGPLLEKVLQRKALRVITRYGKACAADISDKSDPYNKVAYAYLTAMAQLAVGGFIVFDPCVPGESPLLVEASATGKELPRF